MMQQTTKTNADPDPRAVEIGGLFRRTRDDELQDRIKALRGYWDVGDRLDKVRATMKHGEWGPWQKDNEQDLGFGEETVRLLRRFARTNSKPTWDLTEEEVNRLTLSLWGEKGKIGYMIGMTGNPEYTSPIDVVERARRVLGHIDVDPASREEANREIIHADVFYTKDNSGLEHDWPGRVWLNPPFKADLAREFAYHLIDQYMRNITTEAIWLSNASTGRPWWRDLANRGVVCLTGSLSFGKVEDGRIVYPKGGSPVEQAVIYLGERREAFCEEFTKIKNEEDPVELEWWICEHVTYMAEDD